jgi:hypothetical protein
VLNVREGSKVILNFRNAEMTGVVVEAAAE